MEIGWSFPLNGHGVTNGISDPGIETFNGKQLVSLAREICQNSLDAVKKENKPVIIEFNKSTINKNDFFDIENYEKVINDCSDYWNNRGNKKAISFLNKCKNILAKDSLSILRISDFNTKGLQGSNEKHSSTWISLVKSVGVSDKNGDAGGSFGIGKFAPFACSYLRTVVYSTIDCDNLKATQGIAKLPSYEKEDEQLTQGAGFYGYINKNKHLQEHISLDKNFVRLESGTDIFVVGFIDVEDWEKRIIKSILSDFLLAIYNEKIIVKVNNIEVSKKNLDDLINTYSDDKEMNNTLNYYNVLTSKNTEIHTQDFNNMGEIELLTLFEDGFHRKVLTARNSGMMIKELKGISSTIQFASILNLKGKKLNTFFKQLENPAHNDWESDRSDNPKLAQKYIKELKRIVKNKIQELARENPILEMDAVGVGQYLPYEVEDINILDNKNKEEVMNNNLRNISITKVDETKQQNNLKKLNLKRGKLLTDEISDELDGFLNETTNNSKNNVQSGIGESNKTEIDIDGTTNHFEFINTVSSRLVYDYNKDTYKLIFTLDENIEKAILRVSIAGEQSKVRPNLITANNEENKKLQCKDGKILIGNIEKNKKNSIYFKVKYFKNCSFEVGIYGIKK